MSLLFWVLLLHILKQSIIIHTNVTIYCKDFCSSLFFFPFYPPPILKLLYWYIYCLVRSFINIFFSDGWCRWHILWIFAYPQIYFFHSDGNNVLLQDSWYALFLLNDLHMIHHNPLCSKCYRRESWCPHDLFSSVSNLYFLSGWL